MIRQNTHVRKKSPASKMKVACASRPKSLIRPFMAGIKTSWSDQPPDLLHRLTSRLGKQHFERGGYGRLGTMGSSHPSNCGGIRSSIRA